jgi:hypothetical protein
LELTTKENDMDEADLAQKHVEAHLQAAFLARKSRPRSLNGMCIWCKYEPVVAETAFCSAECGEDYFKRKREMSLRMK